METEIKQILAQIRAEYESAERGMKGLSSGTARHKFITARMEHISRFHADLRSLAGDNTMKLVVQQLERLP